MPNKISSQFTVTQFSAALQLIIACFSFTACDNNATQSDPVNSNRILVETELRQVVDPASQSDQTNTSNEMISNTAVVESLVSDTPTLTNSETVVSLPTTQVVVVPPLVLNPSVSTINEVASIEQALQAPQPIISNAPVVVSDTTSETISAAEPTIVDTYPRYHAEPIPKLYFANRVNESGDVVGEITAEFTSDGRNHAAVWRNGVVVDLGINGCSPSSSTCYSRANALNNNGRIVGESTVDNIWPMPYFSYYSTYHPHETIWFNGVVALVPSLGTEAGSIYDINDSNTMVGASRSTLYNGKFSGDYLVHGFVALGGVMVNEIGEYNQYSNAKAVNNKNIATGEIAVDGNNRAFIWKDKVVTILSHLGGVTSSGNDINNNETPMVVGVSTTATGSEHATLWVSEEAIDLGVLGNAHKSSARAVNDGGVIVGSSDNKAIAWFDRTLVDLNGRTDLDNAIKIYDAVDINNKGQILVKADGGYFLLTPIP